MSFSPLDNFRSLVETEIEAGKNYTDIARDLTTQGVPTTRNSIRRAAKRWRHEAPRYDSPTPSPTYVSVEKDSAEFAADVSGPYDIDDLCRERGLAPDDWEVTNYRIGKWESPMGPMESVRASLTRRKRLPDFITQASEVDGIPSPKVRKFKAGDLVACFSDHHTPHHDRRLHSLVCEWLKEHRPEHGLVLGDLLDFPDISRYRYDPDWTASTQACLDNGYTILKDYVTASPDTNWRFCSGNHEFRLQRFVVERAKEVWGLTPGSDTTQDQKNIFGLTNLLRLNELGIVHEESAGSYEYTKIKLNDNLGAAHGHKSPKGSGNSALKTIEQFHHSLIVGHSHRLALVSSPVYDMEGNPTVLMGAENGCLCKIKGGLGHTVNPLWINGFSTATLLPENRFHLDLAQYHDSALTYRGEQYL